MQSHFDMEVYSTWESVCQIEAVVLLDSLLTIWLKIKHTQFEEYKIFRLCNLTTSYLNQMDHGKDVKSFMS